MDNYVYNNDNNTRAIHSLLELQKLVFRKIQRLETQLEANLKLLENDDGGSSSSTTTTTRRFKAIANYLRVRDFEIPRVEKEFNENVETLRGLGQEEAPQHHHLSQIDRNPSSTHGVGLP